ncbi:MAG TPA: AAA family ATPase, partial [Herpetosiphonaceae bacterium]
MLESVTAPTTFLFLNIEGSAGLWERFPRAMPAVIERYQAIARSVIATHHGEIFRMMGDVCCAAFEQATPALVAGLSLQRAVAAATWEEAGPPRLRCALHTGAAERRQGDFAGPVLQEAARLRDLAAGGQILLSASAHAALDADLPAETHARHLGEFPLADQQPPASIYEVVFAAPARPAEHLPAPDTSPAPRWAEPPTNLPSQSTSLVGREEALAAILALLRRPEVRLLTLSGAGGTGKTRLALEAAHQLRPEFGDGTFLAPLSALAEPEQVAAAIAQAVGVTEQSGEPLLESLKLFFREKRLLLLLDNFEHVLPAAPQLAELLAAAPGLKLLATSRSALQIQGEHEYGVPAL